MSSSDPISEAVAGHTTAELVEMFTQTDVLLDEARDRLKELVEATPAWATEQAACRGIYDVRGWILDELAARGVLTLVDPGFEAFE